MSEIGDITDGWSTEERPLSIPDSRPEVYGPGRVFPPPNIPPGHLAIMASERPAEFDQPFAAPE